MTMIHTVVRYTVKPGLEEEPLVTRAEKIGGY
jgi:hypothetical protein